MRENHGQEPGLIGTGDDTRTRDKELSLITTNHLYNGDLQSLYNQYISSKLDLSNATFFLDSFKGIERDLIKIRSDLKYLISIQIGNPPLNKNPLHFT